MQCTICSQQSRIGFHIGESWICEKCQEHIGQLTPDRSEYDDWLQRLRKIWHQIDLESVSL